MPQQTAPTRLLEQGRVTIPVEIRDSLGLEQGDYVMVTVEKLGDSE